MSDAPPNPSPSNPGSPPPSKAPAATHPLPAESPGDSDLILDTLWGRVLEAWDEDKTHNAALDYALRTERLPVLAGRYRALKDDPDKGARAKKRIDAIVIAATQMLLSHKTPARGKVPLPITMSVVGICAATIGWLAYALLRH